MEVVKLDEDISYIDLDERRIGNNIEMLFPEWENENERVCIFSPHCDDAIIGAGYTIEACIRNRAEVYVFMFSCGNAGYSFIEHKEKIVEIRKEESFNAYEKIGIKRNNIIRFEYCDFSILQNIGWRLNNGEEGSFKRVIEKLRELGITRILVPNHYREHIDHLAVNLIGTYYAPQAGDAVVVDWGKPSKVKTTLEYSVWADLSPEDALVTGRKLNLRANKSIMVDEKIENNICEAIKKYKSQIEIIKGLMEARKERLCNNGKYIEVYLSYDSRPKLDYLPYKEYIEELEQI